MAKRGETKRIAVACQGGGAHTAFTAGALDAIVEDYRRQSEAEPRFEIVALSGASGGALCATLAWFELLLEKGSNQPPERFRRFWKTGYPDGIAASTLPEAILGDGAAFLRDAQWPWRRIADSLRSESGDWALHQDLPGPWFPFQFSARLRPYFFHQLFQAVDAAPGAHEARKTLEIARTMTASAAAALPPPWRGWLGGLADDAFELNPLLPDSALRREFDAQDGFRSLIERSFECDRARLERNRAGATEPIETELLIGAADVGDTVRLDARGGDGIENITNFKVFRASERLEQLTEVLLASGAIPELMRAVEIDGDHYWDGVFSQNPPILDLPDVHGPSLVGRHEPARRPEEIWLILINPMTRAEAPRELVDIDDRKNELSGNISLAQEVRAISKMNNVVATLEGGGRKRKYEEIRFRAIQMTPATKAALKLPSKLDRRRTNIDPLFAEGRAQAEAFLKAWRAGRNGATDAAATAAE